MAPIPSAPATLPRGLRVFSCGHSFHVWVAEILAEMAPAAGIVGHVLAGSSPIGGSRVIQHWEAENDKFGSRKALQDGVVDVLTLSPVWFPDQGMMKFATFANAHNPQVRVLIQVYWMPNDEYIPVYPINKYKVYDRNLATLATLRPPYERYSEDIERHVRLINTTLGRTVAYVVPVGEAVLGLREQIMLGQCPGVKTQAELFLDTWGHAAEPIKVLSGYCHLVAIYGINPVGLPMPSLLKVNPAWNEDLNRLLQQLAWDAVTRHPMSGVTA